MKWLKASAAILVLAVLALAAYAVSTAFRSGRPVGFQTARVETQSGPAAVAIWYPTTESPQPTTFIGGVLLSVAKNGPVRGTSLPVVVMSHGNNGSALSHADLAMALASAGYVVAAPTHIGDNYADQSRQSSPTLFNQRADQMRATVDFLTSAWSGKGHVDSRRIGAYGMSAGGFTALTLVGARPDLMKISTHCRQAPEFVCDVLRQTKSPLINDAGQAMPFVVDTRIRSVVAAAPGLGFTLANGLADVRAPVQLWWGSNDETVPYASNAKVIADGLAGRVEAHELQGARHLSFLAPCRLLKPAAACTDAPGFDREAAHQRMNEEVIAFFNRSLAPQSTRASER